MGFGYGAMTDKRAPLANNGGYTSPGVVSSRGGIAGPEAPGSLRDPRLGAAPVLGGDPERERIRQGGAGYQAFQERAMAAPGTSPWEKMMMDRQGLEQAGARDLAGSQAAGAGQNIWNQMAMRGGGGAGARERAATTGQRMGYQGAQNVGQQGAMARADIGLRGEEQRLGMLGQLPGMEMEREKFGAGLADQDYQNMLKRYALSKKDWAAKKMGEEILENK